MKFYLSMSKTFRAWMENKVTTQELAAGQLMFGPYKELLGTEAVPSFVMTFNKEKPKFPAENAQYVDIGSLDVPVLAKWKEFKAMVLTADGNGHVAFTDGNNYPGR